jgi:hypothetical protein
MPISKPSLDISGPGLKAILDATIDEANKVAGLEADVATRALDNAVVKLTGAQTIAGVKTFDSAPVVPANAFPIGATDGLQSALDAKAPAVNATLTTPTINGGNKIGGSTTGQANLNIATAGVGNLGFESLENLTTDRNIFFSVGNANRSITLGGNVTTAGNFTTVGAFAATLNFTAATTVTLPTSGTLATTIDVDTVGGMADLITGFEGAALEDENDPVELRIVDKNGREIAGFDPYGGVIHVGQTLVGIGEGASGGHPVELSAGNLVVTTEDGQQTVNLSPWTAERPAPGLRGVHFSWNKPLRAAKTRVAMTADLSAFVADGPLLSRHIIAVGQSEVSGSNATPVPENFASSVFGTWLRMPDVGPKSDIRFALDPDELTAQALNASDIVGTRPLFSRTSVGANYGMTPAESFMRAEHAFVLEKLGFHMRMVGSNHGHGGFAYTSIKKGTQVYDNVIAGQTKLVAIDKTEGWKPVCPSIIIVHGTSDAANTGYKANMIEYQDDLETDLRAIYDNQAARIPFLMAQVSSFATSQNAAALAQLALHEEDVPVSNEYAFVLVSPTYFLDLAPDVVHWTAESEILYGEYVHKANVKTGHGIGRFEPLRPNTIIQSGSNIDITVHGRVGDLVIDTTAVTERSGTNKGFLFRSDSGDVVPTSVTIINAGSTIRLGFAAPPSGTNKKVRYAMEGHAGARDVSTIPRGNIHDSDPWKSRFDPTVTLPNWLVAFEKAVS